MLVPVVLILLVLTRTGGHLGWSGGSMPLGPSWVDELCARFLLYHRRKDGRPKTRPWPAHARVISKL